MKNAVGRGVPRSSTCSSAVARSAQPAARPAYTAVDEFPKLLAALGAITGIPRTARVTRTPATTASAATTAVAAPPAHSRRPFTRTGPTTSVSGATIWNLLPARQHHPSRVAAIATVHIH